MPEATEKRSYKDTLNLPKTGFGMKANLVQTEPASLKRWQQARLYDQVRQARRGAPQFSFHDGPPYANGSIHLGHLLNKVLKDLVVRSKTMAGFDVPYIPGWDCHGLPIEHKVMQELGDKARAMEPWQVRRKCLDSAEKFIKLQAAQMQRLLTLADYDHPYMTMDPAYEAAVLEVFADLVTKGLVYRALKPVHWSIENRTALAEAELEYYDRQDPSVYVLFEVNDSDKLRAVLAANGLAGQPVHLMIWTTTPWTLPANMAVAVHPKFSYGLYRFEAAGRSRLALLACDLAPKVLAHATSFNPAPIKTFTGEELTALTYRHPFVGDAHIRPVVLADYVTLEDGTGLVHTATGHGVEDYQTGIRCGLEIYCPVRGDGTFDDTAPVWLRGQTVWKGNHLVVEKLRESGHLFFDHLFTHSYPHDWRGKTPVIFRATEQWFIGVDRGIKEETDTLRGRALRVTDHDVRFVPDWGRNRMRGMLESRPDWCISRQRAWGLPIPAFFPPTGVAVPEGQSPVLLTAASVRAVAGQLRKHGSDYWFKATPAELLAGYDAVNDPAAPAWAREVLKSQVASLTKSRDIFDVWFESGSSWNAVVRQRQGDQWFPTDLYLEGSDQHRGWFQLSLLPALGVTGKSPFKAVLTHGFMVDKDGRKMSKSLGNALEVETLLKDYGADVCRWWVSSLNTDNDIKVDPEFFRLAGEEYRKVRNTIRYLLSNLYDFDPAKDRYAFTDKDATCLDAWALSELAGLVRTVRAGYDAFNFRQVQESLFNFCNQAMSAVYLAAAKDRMYCDPPAGPRRRRAQTAMFDIAHALVRLLAPILPHTADEAWSALHNGKPEPASVHLALLPAPVDVPCDPDWAKVMLARQLMLKLVEDARAPGSKLQLENPLDCGVAASLGPKAAYLHKFDPRDLADLCGISRVELSDQPAGESELFSTVAVLDLRNEPRCERSWKRDGTVKLRSDGGQLSDRDAQALGLA